MLPFQFSSLRLTLGLLLLAAVLFGSAGCDDTLSGGGDKGGGGGSGSDAFVGTWQLYKGKELGGDPIWYVHFRGDGTFFFSNFPDGTKVRSTGTYTVSGGQLTGPFANPPTGNGRVEAKLVGSMLDLDFIEYWHTPNKVVPYSGKAYTGGAVAHLTGGGSGSGSSSGNGTAVLRPSEDGPVGFLWKPEADSDGKLVMVFPEDISPTVAIGEIHNAFPPKAGSLVETGTLAYRSANGGRAHFRFSKPGSGYGKGIYAVGIMPDGKIYGFAIPDGAERVN